MGERLSSQTRSFGVALGGSSQRGLPRRAYSTKRLGRLLLGQYDGRKLFPLSPGHARKEKTNAAASPSPQKPILHLMWVMKQSNPSQG